MDGLGRGELNARMLEAARRLAAALADNGTPRVSEAHREYSHVIQAGLDRTTRVGEQSAADIDRAGSAQRDRAAVPAETGAHVREPARGPDSTAGTRSTNTFSENRTHPDGRDRFEISSEEARELFERVRDREPEFAGAANGVIRVDTSAGPAVVRFETARPIETFVKHWLPETTAIRYGSECGVRTPRLLYAGTDSATGKDFMVMQYVPGETHGFDDPELMNWLPDLLDQVKLIAAHPLPAEMAMDIPTWQRQMIQHADNAYHNLTPEHRARLDQLGLGPLSDYVRPDLSRAGEPTYFAHNDLYPGNLQFDEQKNCGFSIGHAPGPVIRSTTRGSSSNVRCHRLARPSVRPLTCGWIGSRLRTPMSMPRLSSARTRPWRTGEGWRWSLRKCHAPLPRIPVNSITGPCSTTTDCLDIQSRHGPAFHAMKWPTCCVDGCRRRH